MINTTVGRRETPDTAAMNELCTQSPNSNATGNTGQTHRSNATRKRQMIKLLLNSPPDQQHTTKHTGIQAASTCSKSSSDCALLVPGSYMQAMHTALTCHDCGMNRLMPGGGSQQESCASNSPGQGKAPAQPAKSPSRPLQPTVLPIARICCPV